MKTFLDSVMKIAETIGNMNKICWYVQEKYVVITVIFQDLVAAQQKNLKKDPEVFLLDEKIPPGGGIFMISLV